jgi:D-lactate dehydrogenase (cytochrome)
VLEESLVNQLKNRFGERFSISQAVRDQHGQGESWVELKAPDAVVWIRSTDEAVTLVKLCAQFSVPIIPYGAGTSLEGHIQAPHGGICVDLSQMNDIVAVHTQDMDCVVQPGVSRKQLNNYLNETGLFFPVDPGADASIGGMTSTRASGTNAVRYGTMKDNVLSVTAVLADGRVIKTARRARKSSAGYDLTRLFVGAEGTLGLITEINLKLHPIPEAMSAARCGFSNVDDAVQCVIQVIQCGIPIARIELLDELTVKAINRYSKMDMAEQPTLFLEFHGSENSVKEQAEFVAGLVADNGGSDFSWATQAEDRNRIWEARHNAYYASVALRPGSKGWSTDVCVPISELAACIRETREDLDNSFLLAPIVGHVGDGNFHVLFVIDPDKPEEIEEAHRLNGLMVERALRLGGTCTGEHGIGVGKLKYLRQELGDSVDVMQSIKLALDPAQIFNPGKTVWG